MQDYTTQTPSYEIPYGYCHCGCNQKTPIAKGSRTNRGWIKDQPKRFISGHGCNTNHTPQQAFWNYATPGKPDDCWLWQGYTEKNGYGRARFRGKRYAAHRLGWELHFGPIPEGMNVLHKCDVRNCINPQHWFLGTAKDNMQDKMSKGRGKGMFKKGETHPNTKINKTVVIDIRKQFSQGQKVTAIAKRLGISYSIVWHIVHYHSWTHI